MKWLSRLIAVLLGVFWLGVTLSMILPAFRGGASWASFADGIAAKRFTGIIVCVLTLVAIAARLLAFRSKPSRPKYLSYETEHGAISISLKALQDYLSSLKDEFPAVLGLTPKVSADEVGLGIVLEVDVRAGESVPDMSRRLQDRVRKLVQEKVGISEIKSIEIRVEEIVNTKGPKEKVSDPVPPPAGEVP